MMSPLAEALQRVRRQRVSAAALGIAANMDDYLEMIRLFMTGFTGLSDVEIVEAVKEACEIWLRSSAK